MIAITVQLLVYVIANKGPAQVIQMQVNVSNGDLITAEKIQAVLPNVQKEQPLVIPMQELVLDGARTIALTDWPYNAYPNALKGQQLDTLMLVNVFVGEMIFAHKIQAAHLIVSSEQRPAIPTLGNALDGAKIAVINHHFAGHWVQEIFSIKFNQEIRSIYL